MIENKLSINRDKTTFAEIMIGKKRARTPGDPPVLNELQPDGSTKLIKTQRETKLLRATIQDNMNWASHMEEGEDALLPDARKSRKQLRYLMVCNWKER